MDLIQTVLTQQNSWMLGGMWGCVDQDSATYIKYVGSSTDVCGINHTLQINVYSL